MTITTLDGVIAGSLPGPRLFMKAVSGTPVIGRPQTTWGLAGIPGPGAWDTTLNGVTLAAPQNGQLPFTNPAGGLTSYISRQFTQASIQAAVTIADRLWHNGGINITSTGTQNITSPTWPARDINGATNGDGVLLAVEVSSLTGAGTPTLTVSYTNSAGTSGRTGTNIQATTAAASGGATYIIGLQAGDTGVKSVQSLTLSATWTSGTINMVAFRPLTQMAISAGSLPMSVDAITGGFTQLYNDTVPYIYFTPISATQTQLNGSLSIAQG